MARFFFVAVALLLAANSINCDSSSEEVVDKVTDKVKSKHIREYLSNNKNQLNEGLGKLEETCPGVKEKLKDAFKQVHECDENIDDSMTICQAIHTYTLNCTKPLLKVADDCLPEKVRGLPTLGVKSLVSVADFLCKQTGESIFELANPCLWEDWQGEHPQLEQCEEKIKTLMEKHKDKEHLPNTSEVCTTITDLRSCMQARGSVLCKNQKTKDVFIGMFDAIIAPCSHLNEA